MSGLRTVAEILIGLLFAAGAIFNVVYTRTHTAEFYGSFVDGAWLPPAKTFVRQVVLPNAVAFTVLVIVVQVAVALGIELRSGTVRAEGDLDFRGALGVDPDAAVGFSGVRLRFEIDSDASPAERDRLIELTERYCVVYQTLRSAPQLGLETHFLAPGEEQSPVGMEGVEEAEAALEARLNVLRLAASHAL